MVLKNLLKTRNKIKSSVRLLLFYLAHPSAKPPTKPNVLAGARPRVPLQRHPAWKFLFTSSSLKGKWDDESENTTTISSEGPSFTFQIEFFCMQVCGMYIMGRQGRDGQKTWLKWKWKRNQTLPLNSQSVLGNYHLAFSLRIDGVLFLQSKLDTFNTIKCLS